MSATPELGLQAVETAAKIIPEKGRLRESRPENAEESGRIVEVAFQPANTRFRESLSHPPRKPRNAERRSREYLTPAEVEKLLNGAQSVGRHGHRDSTLILVAYRHALRVSELISLRWDQIDLVRGLMHVNRRKNGTPSTHPVRGPELRALRRLQREYPGCAYVFNGERKGPLTDSGVRKIVARAGRAARIDFPTHPHMLRHAAGYKLANDGQDTRAIQHYLGHKNITHTVRYTELSPERFKDFWQD
jgi:type 1 fimbriae regulatory protein FimE